MVSGLSASFVEAPLELQKQLVVPENHYQACREADTLYQGNAAGNTEKLLDLSGNNLPPGPLPEGFTPRGIVALVFSIISAFLGLAAIAWYGAAPLGKSGPAATEKRSGEDDGESIDKSYCKSRQKTSLPLENTLRRHGFLSTKKRIFSIGALIIYDFIMRGLLTRSSSVPGFGTGGMSVSLEKRCGMRRETRWVGRGKSGEVQIVKGLSTSRLRVSVVRPAEMPVIDSVPDPRR